MSFSELEGWLEQLQGNVNYQQQQINGILAWESKINNIFAKVNVTMTGLSDLTAQVASTDATLDAIATAFTTLQTTVASLQAQIEATAGEDAALSALSAQLGTHTAAVSTLLNPPAPVTPVVTPTVPETPVVPTPAS